MKTYTDLEQKQIIAANLQELITRSGKDQRTISIDLEINPPTFNQWVTGKATPQVSTLRRVAEYFKVPFTYLINKRDAAADNEGNIEVLPPDLAIKYSELSSDGKTVVNTTIETEYIKYSKKVAEYNRVVNLDKISNLSDARVIIGDSVAFDGYVSDEEILQVANEILKIKKKKYRKK